MQRQDAHRAAQGLAGLTPSFTGNWTVRPTIPWSSTRRRRACRDMAATPSTSPRSAWPAPVTCGSPTRIAIQACPDLRRDSISTRWWRCTRGRSCRERTATATACRTTSRRIFMTNPADPDTDGDGVQDGEEVATCHDRTAPRRYRSSCRRSISKSPNRRRRWCAGARSARGSPTTWCAEILGALRSIGGMVDLASSCIENDSTDLSNRGLLDPAARAVRDSFTSCDKRRAAAVSATVCRAPSSRGSSLGDCPVRLVPGGALSASRRAAALFATALLVLRLATPPGARR